MTPTFIPGFAPVQIPKDLTPQVLRAFGLLSAVARNELTLASPARGIPAAPWQISDRRAVRGAAALLLGRRK